jgi:hypothetical protein
MTSHQTAIFNLSTDMDQLMTLEFTVSDHVGARNPSKWISPVGFRGSACVFSREHPLAMNYISDDKSSLLCRLDPDGDLYRVLADWEAKVKHANAPHTATTSDLVNYPEPGSSYPPSVKLKTAYTTWVDEAGNSITQEQALSERRSLLSYVIAVSKLNFFRNKHYFSCVLKSAKVGDAPSGMDAGMSGGGVDYTGYL